MTNTNRMVNEVRRITHMSGINRIHAIDVVEI